MFGRAKRPADIESGLKDLSSPEVLDFDDDSWVIDHHRNNLIEKISKPGNTWYDALLGDWRRKKSGRIRSSSNNEPQGEIEHSYIINLAELQRLRLRQLQRRLVQHVVDLRYNAEEPAGWADDLRDYVQALRDHDYMCQHIWQPNDPFYVTGERYVERMMLQSAMRGMEHDVDPLRWAKSRRAWTTASDKPVPIGGTRDGNYWEAWFAGFRRRLGVAAVGAAFLIAPMWLMVLRRTLYTALVSTTVFVAVFGLLMALWLEKLTEVMSATAAYAAVLVVFVGLTTDSG
ncbi:uncharacterized protein THITE_2051711 [Thermothielavioides terrestris NRRL 8126]|uniref:DUF6594 domain-containing protein n=1 Tax=Thermothielavioides terrestris (strain ATCC 38088 / NRRL 8126) TaxID=578455 RepID=G2R5T0_THETT|nr:uncharacterized protein THITE_2051711 [Thermothielavioides terrestris NRRL 8126]AEO67519.1 hypothetical protein THITE_2051711 [Thermothielavioides terrestris NRRL 8126]